MVNRRPPELAEHATVHRNNVMLRPLSKTVHRLKNDNSGMAMVELAVSLPFFLTLSIGGVELTNFTLVSMQLNKITLNVADNAARMGTRTADGIKIISESEINDVFAGAMRAGQRIGLDGTHSHVEPSSGREATRGNARIILSSFEALPGNTTDPRYHIRWQRCAGAATHYTSSYGTPDTAASSSGIGPDRKKIVPPEGSSIMFVETQYHYTPIIVTGFSVFTGKNISQIASMAVREARDLAGPPGGDGVYNPDRVAVSNCRTR